MRAGDYKMPDIDVLGLDKLDQKYALVLEALEDTKAIVIEKSNKPTREQLMTVLKEVNDSEIMHLVETYDRSIDDLKAVDLRIKQYLELYIKELRTQLASIYEQVRISNLQRERKRTAPAYMPDFDLNQRGEVEDTSIEVGAQRATQRRVSPADLVSLPPEQMMPQTQSKAPKPKPKPKPIQDKPPEPEAEPIAVSIPLATDQEPVHLAEPIPTEPPMTEEEGATNLWKALTYAQKAEVLKKAYFDIQPGHRTGPEIVKLLTQRGFLIDSLTVRVYCAKIGMKLEGHGGWKDK
jgi:hypothetical protein